MEKTGRSRKTRFFSGRSGDEQIDFSHVVVGGGVVGLAIARALQRRETLAGRPGRTLLVERHSAVGTETSSRNSEVIHAGLYYGRDSLKTRLCLRGKELLYDYCQRNVIPYRKCGKWIVAQTETEQQALEKIHSLANDLGVPTRFIPLDNGKQLEPEIRAQKAILDSPSSGIVDSHSLMMSFLGQFETFGGTLSLNSTATGIEPRLQGSASGWRITIASTPVSTPTAIPHDEIEITSDTIVNSAGLSAIPLSNSILPPSRHVLPLYAKGTYYSTTALPPVSRLIYPVPPTVSTGGLGTHLTLDIAGHIRFGPDVEWTDSPHDLSPSNSALRIAAAAQEIASYLPGLNTAMLKPNYAGMRPKMKHASAGFTDFYIRREDGLHASDGCSGPCFVNLLGIESPGLTCSLSIAEMVENLVFSD